MIVKTPFDNTMKMPDINILELFVNKYPSNSDFYILTLSRIFIFWPLCTNQASLLVKIEFKFEACSLNINLCPNYKPIAMTLISELWPNMSLNSIELTLLDAFLWGGRHLIFSLLNYWGNKYHWRIYSKGWQYSTTRRHHTPGSHNNDKLIAALALANRTEAAINLLCISHFHIDNDLRILEKMLASKNVIGEFKIETCVMPFKAVESLWQGLEQSASIQTLHLDLRMPSAFDVSKLL